MYNYNDYYGYNTPSTTSILAGLGAYIFIMWAVVILMIICLWKIFKKAGKNGWEAIIPIYNIVTLVQIVNLPTWYTILFFVPFVNIYIVFKVYIELAHRFDKSTGFGVAMVFFSVICMPILAFGPAEYENSNSQPYINNNYQNQLNQQFQQQNQNVQVSNKYCPNCGNQINIGADACFMCGHKF